MHFLRAVCPVPRFLHLLPIFSRPRVTSFLTFFSTEYLKMGMMATCTTQWIYFCHNVDGSRSLPPDTNSTIVTSIAVPFWVPQLVVAAVFFDDDKDEAYVRANVDVADGHDVPGLRSRSFNYHHQVFPFWWLSCTKIASLFIYWGWYMCLVNSLMVSAGIFFLTQSRSKVKTPLIVRRYPMYLIGSHGMTILDLPLLKNSEIKREFSLVFISCHFCFTHINLHSRPLAVEIDTF